MTKQIEEGAKHLGHLLHVVKPILLELVLFVVFVAETYHWLMGAVFGGAE